ncbi:conditioned medium-induced protein 4 [Haladaptatus sp. NG-WS-4]
MDKKTEELRDIFIDVTDEATVTEEQEETHGSLGSEQKVNERLRDIVEDMRERFTFDTSLGDAELVSVVRRFSAGDDDEEIAAELGTSEDAVTEARLDLHLFRDADTDAPFDIETLRVLLADGTSIADCAERLDANETTVSQYQHVVEARNEARAVSQQYINEFENVLQDRELSDRMAQDIQQDGLDDATEGMETNVSF